MRAYLAVIKDSFREAMSSWVLWLALVGIALILLALAPLSLLSEEATELRPRELVNAEVFVKKLIENKNQADTPAGHIWSLLESDDQARIQEMLDPAPTRRGPPGRRANGGRRVVSVLNTLLKQDDFYKSEAWSEFEAEDALASELENAAISGDALASRNLRLLAATFPGEIRIRDSQQVSLTYAGNVMIGPLSGTRAELEPIVLSQVTLGVSWFVGFFGIAASLLVTASIVPRTFEPGEIALLLSKPVNRSFLFLTKFVGACTFTLLYATVLVGGVWLLLGLRFGIWKQEILWCIPLYVFLFSVYYSVVATTSLIWRNAIVGLVVVAIFWAIVSIVGLVKGLLDELTVKPARVTEIVPAGERLFAVNGRREVLQYDFQVGAWNAIFARDLKGVPPIAQRFLFAGTRFRPSYDKAQDRLVAVEQKPSMFGGVSRANVVTGSPLNEWERRDDGETPDAVPRVLIDSKGRVVLPGRRGVYLFSGLSEGDRKTKAFWDKVTGGIMPTSSKNAFEELSGDNLPELASEFTSDIHPQTDSIFTYSAGKLYRLDVIDGKYSLGETRDFESEEDAVFSVGGDYVTMSFGDGSIRVLESDSLEDKLTDQFEEGILPRVCASSPDGSVSAVLTHDGAIWMFDGKTGQKMDWLPPEDGYASAIAFNDEGEMYVADGWQDIARYTVGTSTPIEENTVPADNLRNVYRWLLSPIYTVLPQPSEVDNFVQYIMTGRRSESIVDNGGGPFARQVANLREDRVTFDVWEPLFKNVAFVVVLLAFGCFYVSRKDF